MILQQVKQYLQEQKKASLREIARHVNSTPEAVMGMIEFWIRKGMVNRVTPIFAETSCKTRCSSCSLPCTPFDQEVFYFREESGNSI